MGIYSENESADFDPTDQTSNFPPKTDKFHVIFANPSIWWGELVEKHVHVFVSSKM